jgi:hypothetical protein
MLWCRLVWMSGTKIAIGFVALENVIDRNQQAMRDGNNGAFMPATGIVNLTGFRSSY